MILPIKLKTTLVLLLSMTASLNLMASSKKIIKVQQINPTTVELIDSNNQRTTIDFYGNNIFRLFEDPKGGILRDPEAKPEAQILVDNPRRAVESIQIEDKNNAFHIATPKIEIIVNKENSNIQVKDLAKNKTVLETIENFNFTDKKSSLKLKKHQDEYFYGGGVQNGRFSHQNKIIAIENQNSWTDGGVASPNPFYWSTNGYGIMWYTFKKGTYDFGASNADEVILEHETPYADLFVMINDTPMDLLNDFYQLTGNPILIPKFGLYQGHLNAYNRDYWKENEEKGILFEDGKKYIESQKDNGGIKESLNEEKNNYQFSARAVIDRYQKADMPLGWILPNDGYGAGYGQEDTLDGNIENLRKFTEYANSKGVEVGLWTQSDLHPKEGIEALLQRDIVKEVRDAGVRVLKTDVAWVGAGYSFGLNGVADVAQIMNYYGNEARPFIISLDGWAGTQRHAGIWSGDQTGGVWEYIRFHIPTYIGSGLSGNPNICSDMDGIFGGKNPIVNTRDFQWKTFSLMELNMDGWGSNPKYPQALGEPTTSINRHYLKLKSTLIPYTYSIAKEAIDGMPVIRAMFLEYPNKYTLGTATQYQYLFGSNFLVAPIYQSTSSDEKGNDIRNNIYLPSGYWIDYFTGQAYEGDRIINSYQAPIWKLPVFVKAGAIIPLANPSNNISEINKNLRIYEFYPYGKSTFTEYDDDGISNKYLKKEGATTIIESQVINNKATLTLQPTVGSFEGMTKEKATEFIVNINERPKKITIEVRNALKKNKIEKLKLQEVNNIEEFNKGQNVYFYDEKPNLNKFASSESSFASIEMIKNPQLLIKIEPLDICNNAITVEISDYTYNYNNQLLKKEGNISPISTAQVTPENIEAYTLKPTWKADKNADYYEILFDEMLYSTINDTTLLFEQLKPETNYQFQIRGVNSNNSSDWVAFNAKTKSNPLEFALKGIKGKTSVPNQGRSLAKLFDFNETDDLWHTKYGENAIPFDLVMDLQTINKLDKMHYLPRTNAGNGTILKGSVYYSMDNENWNKAEDFVWDRNGEDKIVTFENKPTARYIKLHVTEAIGNFGSGREIYVFKVPGTESYLPGDINNDGKIDENDLTSYTNYTGLRQGDADFEGYVSNGDVNKNGLIDAYDISVVTTQLDGGISNSNDNQQELKGEISIIPNKRIFNAGDVIDLKVEGKNMQSINGLSFALPYNPQEFEFIGIENTNVNEMQNLTKDRLHTNGEKSLYPTFVNLGEKPLLEGNNTLFTIKLKAKKNGKFNLEIKDLILVDRNLKYISK